MYESTLKYPYDMSRTAQMVGSLNKAFEIFVSYDEKTPCDILMNGIIRPFADTVGLDRVCIYRYKETEKGMRLGMTYLWDKSAGGVSPIDERVSVLPDIQAVQNWLGVLLKGGYVNSRVRDMPEDEATFWSLFGVKKIFIAPVSITGEFWGAVALQDHTDDDYLYDNPIEVNIMQMAARLYARAIVRAKTEREKIEMEESIRQLETKAEKIYYDVLTGIYNRRYLEETLKRILSLSSRAGSVLSLMMIDIDFFKQYNDTYGHSAGDNCLKIVAETISKSLTRADDFAVRYGGEEFVVVLPNTDENGARLIAERILKNIRKLNTQCKNGETAGRITISIGVTTGNVEHTQSGEDYIRQADILLYQSKRNGRDRYTFAHFSDSLAHFALAAENLELIESVKESNKTIKTLTSVLNGINAMICVTNPNTDEILFINDYMKNHYGIKGGAGDICYRVLKDGKKERCEFCPCRQLDAELDKTIVWEEYNAQTDKYYRNTDRYIDWLDGEKVHIQHKVDITDIKQTQKKLQMMSSIVHKSPNIIFHKKINGECLYVNPAASTSTGYSEEELLADIFGVLFGEKLTDSLKSTIIATLMEKGVAQYEIKGYRKDGELRTFSVTSFLVEGDSYASIAYDITEMSQNVEFIISKTN